MGNDFIFQDHTLRISYNRGNFTVDLAKLLPSTQKEFKMLLDIVNMSDDKDELVKQLYDFVKSAMSKENAAYFAEYNKVDAYIKKVAALKDILVKTYGITEDEPENKPETIRSKSSVVYVLEYGKIVCKTGYSFEKGGYTFGVVKTHEKPARYTVYLYGVIIGAYTTLKSKAEAIASIDDRILDLLEKKSDEIEEVYHKPYIAAMIEAGYMTDEEAIEKRNESINERLTTTDTDIEEVRTEANTDVKAEADPVNVVSEQPTKAQYGFSLIRFALRSGFQLSGRKYTRSAIRSDLKASHGIVKRVLADIPYPDIIKPPIATSPYQRYARAVSGFYQGYIMVGSGLSPPILKSVIRFKLKCCS